MQHYCIQLLFINMSPIGLLICLVVVVVVVVVASLSVLSRIVWLFAIKTIASDVYCDECLLSIFMTVVVNVRI